MSFTTYVTTWSCDPLSQVQDMCNNNVLDQNTRVVIAFASFNFDSTDYIPGFNSISIEETQQIVQTVKAKGAFISLSVGGATYPFYGSDLYTRPGDLAGNINSLLQKCGFDGVDFDIEDAASNVPADFAYQAASLINTLRSLNSSLYISLTTAAQAWALNCYQQQLINFTIGNLDAWQPMEYDLWIQPESSYYAQIGYDLQFYLNTWGVSPSKLILGLMPGKDDLGNDMSLQDTLNLTSYAKTLGLKGVMIWDADTDSLGVDGNAPYAYSLGIKSMLRSVYNLKRSNRL